MAAEGAPAGKLRVVHYGLRPAEPYDRADARARLLAIAGFPADSILFGTVSRLIGIKGIDDAIAAVGLLQSDTPKARLVVAGDGPERESTERLAEEMGIADRVDFMGDQESISDILPAADVFLLPSQHESFGLAALEAMAAEKSQTMAGLIRDIDESRDTANLSSATRLAVLRWLQGKVPTNP